MRARVALAVLALIAAASEGRAAAPIYDPVILNIGMNCQWQQSCERKQRAAMKSARKYMAAAHPPAWKIQLCNKNARRAPSRIDWAGFNACIRNPQLSPPRRHR